MKQLGGTEKSYALIRSAKQEKPEGDPRRLLASSARVLGRAVSSVSARPSALARLSHRMRVHTHGGRCVSAHLDPEMAGSAGASSQAREAARGLPLSRGQLTLRRLNVERNSAAISIG
jgi:hypothetical protein